MEIVISIPDETYNKIHKGEDLYHADHNVIVFAIEHGSPLPKGHGRLIDGDVLEQDVVFRNRRAIDIVDRILKSSTIVARDKEVGE